jgi:signal transduction histidine kinase
LLVKVLYNLVDNSIVHGGELTQITITSREREGGLDLTYCDDGQGIPESIRPNLFTKGCGRRTGLGLYLSKEILNRSGMSITEAGEPGKGVRFIIGVPAGRYRFSSRTYDPIKDPSDVNELPACAPSGARP